MKFEQTRRGFRIVPEGIQDEAFIEDTLNLKIEGNFVALTRVDYTDGKIWCLSTTHLIPTVKERAQ